MLREWLMHIEFEHAWVLGFLILVPVMIIEYMRRNNRMNASMLVTTTHFIKFAQSSRTHTRHLLFILRCLAIIFFIVALAKPRQKFAEQQTNGEGIDIVLCFDISGSMTEKDFLPNRIDAAKEVAQQFVENRPGDRIGIVIFSNLSFTLCPLTTDHNTVISQLKGIESGYLQDEGTAIGSGIATSVDRLRSSKSKSKVIILLTDGVDFGGTIPPDVAIQMAQLYHIKIYTIGVGSQQEIEEVVDSPLGPIRQKKMLEFNEALLKNMAQQTGGEYFHATDKDALQKIYLSINSLEKSKVEVTTYNRYTDKFFLPLLLGIIFFFVEILLRYTVFSKFP